MPEESSIRGEGPWVDEPRLGDREKVTGAATYVDDLPEPPDVVYAASLQSPYAHARILSIDSSRALQLPGVLAVLDRENSSELGLQLEPASLDPDHIAADKARFEGDLLAMVAATDLRLARSAVELIDVQYELLPPVFSAEEALAPGAPILHEHLGTNSAFDDSFEWGDVTDGLREADHVFEARITCPTVFHHPMEPVGSCLASYVDDTVQLWLPSNTPNRDARNVARVFGIPLERVRVQVPHVGGGFGAKEMTREMVLALALSRKLGRPVKMVATELESFRVAVRHAMTCDARVGVGADGRLVALDMDITVDCGAYFAGGRVATHNACITGWGCYRIPHYRARARTAFTNKVPATPHRGTGKTQTTFAIETIIDRVARQMEIDPVEFRMRNVLLPGEPVARSWRVRGEESQPRARPMDVDFPALMRQALDAIEVQRAPTGNPRLPRVRGKGLALSLRHGAKGEDESRAMATLDPDGTLTICHNAADLGQGVYTMIAVVASRTLGVPRSQVRVEKPDTGNALPFAGNAAQRTTVQMGNAVQAACEQLRRQLLDLATEVKGGSPDAWEIAEGRIHRPGESYAVAEILQAAGGITLQASGSDSEVLADAAFGSFDYWAPGAAAAEVEVDTETGELHVLQYSVLADAGKVLHYASARGQLEGGAVMGFGLALHEELVYEEGQVQNADPFQYRLPLMRDIPAAFRTHILEGTPGPGPFGAKGIAQTSIPCVAPAIANAIYDAIGVPMDSTPLTPERVLRALGKLNRT